MARDKKTPEEIQEARNKASKVTRKKYIDAGLKPLQIYVPGEMREEIRAVVKEYVESRGKTTGVRSASAA